eukprot:2746415-Pleurochrysis_carterae.AAC.1
MSSTGEDSDDGLDDLLRSNYAPGGSKAAGGLSQSDLNAAAMEISSSSDESDAYCADCSDDGERASDE